MEKDKKRMGRWMKAVIGITALFLLYTVFGFFIAPVILKSVIAKRLTENLHRQVSIRDIKINPYSLTLRLSGFSAGHREQPGVFISFEEIYANLQILSVIKRAVILSEFQVAGPYLELIRTGEQLYNFSDLLEDQDMQESPSKQPSKPVRFSVNNIRITGGAINFSDDPRKAVHRVEDLDLSIPFLSNFPYHARINVEPHFSASVNGTPVSFQGDTRPFAENLQTILNVEIRNLDVTHYLGYLPFEIPFRVDSGFIDMKMEMAYAQTKENVASLVVSGNAGLRDFKITEMNGEPRNAFARVDVFIGRSDLLSGKLHVEKLNIVSPTAHVVRNAAGEINLAKWIEATEGKKLEQKEPDQRFILMVDEILLSNGRIDIRDETVDGPFEASLEKITLHVSNFTNDINGQAQASLSLSTDAEERVTLDGSFSVNPLSAQGNVSVQKIRLNRYAPYYQEKILFQVESGELELETDFQFVQEEGPTPSQLGLTNLSTRLNGLRLKRESEEKAFFETPVITLSNASVDVPGQRVVLGNVFTEKGDLRVIRSANGVISLARLVPSAPANDGKQVRNVPGEFAEDRWEVLLEKGEISGYGVSFKDAAPAQPVTLDVSGVAVTLENIATTKNTMGTVALAMNLSEKGRFALSGKAGISPPVAQLSVDVADLDIQPYQPYWKDKVNVTVADGAVSTKGHVEFGLHPGKDPTARYKGEIRIADFRVLDDTHARELLTWKNLEMGGVDLSLNPTHILTGVVTLSDFYSRISIDEKGRVNLQDVAVSDASKEAASEASKLKEAAALSASEAEKKAEPEAPSPIKIDVKSVRLKGGRIDYSDRFIRPHVDAELSRLEGAVTGLTSEETAQADVHIEGRVNQHAPLEITGKINPLGRDLYLDLKVRTNGVDLSPATPYAGKYMGYVIEKGKLSLQLDYHVDHRKLKAENRVFLDQLTLGETVESPDATNLPVALAVSLLKNRAGEITLDLPVSGSLDDPEFRIGKVILQIVVNLLEKVLTAPFALLGAIAGGGEELSYVEFEPGSAEMDKGGPEKLEKLVEVLYDRPGLRIEVEGHADLKADREALKQKALVRKLKEQKLKALKAGGKGGMALKDIRIAPEEYGMYLERAFREEKGALPGKESADKTKKAAKTRAEGASAKSDKETANKMTVEEMKTALLQQIRVSDDQLRLLASERAERTRDFLVASKKLEARRVFLSEPKSLSPKPVEKVKDSRVDFRLK